LFVGFCSGEISASKPANCKINIFAVTEFMLGKKKAKEICERLDRMTDYAEIDGQQANPASSIWN
jgi:hypothetical protein